MAHFEELPSIQELVVIDRDISDANRPAALVYVNVIGSVIIRLARSGMSDAEIVIDLSRRLNIPTVEIQKEFEALKLSLRRALA